MKWLRKLKNKLKAKFTAGHHAMSLEEMMAMSAEELGRRFREHGDWYHSKKWNSLNDKVEKLVCLPICTVAVCMLIVILIELFVKPLYNIIFNMHAIVIIFGIYGLSIIILLAISDFFPSSFLKRKCHYDEFDNLVRDNSKKGAEASSLINFIDYLDNYGEDDKETSLGEYRNAMHDMIQMYYNHMLYTDEEIGRILKLMIPVAFMVNDGVKINIQNYEVLDIKYNLTEQAVELDKCLNDKIAKREAENNADREREERMKQKKKEQEKQIRQKKEKQAAVESVGRFINLENRIKTNRNILNESPEYNRIEDATKKIHEKTEAMNSAAENMTAEKD